MNPRYASPFIGQHCETVATGTLLQHLGCAFSEPLLFGLGEGLGFVFLNLATLRLPFIGGRTKPFAVTTALCRNLGLHLEAHETSSKAKAWATLETRLARGEPVGLQVDCYDLPYFAHAPHFAGHFVAATRMLDDDLVEVVDTIQQGSVQRVSREQLSRARHARGPMSAKARAYTIRGEAGRQLERSVLTAVGNTSRRYLAPEFSGSGARGIAKLARSLPGWLAKGASPDDLRLSANLMERAGTGGGLFRNLYRDFLSEAAALVPAKAKTLLDARDQIGSAAERWTMIAHQLEAAARDARAEHLATASQLCQTIAENELAAMRALAGL